MPRHPFLALQTVDEANDRGFVYVQLVSQLDLGDARVGFYEHHQTENGRRHLPLAPGSRQVAPKRDLSAADVVSQQVRKYSDIDWPTWSAPILRDRLGFGFSAGSLGA